MADEVGGGGLVTADGDGGLLVPVSIELHSALLHLDLLVMFFRLKRVACNIALHSCPNRKLVRILNFTIHIRLRPRGRGGDIPPAAREAVLRVVAGTGRGTRPFPRHRPRRCGWKWGSGG